MSFFLGVLYGQQQEEFPMRFVIGVAKSGLILDTDLEAAVVRRFPADDFEVVALPDNQSGGVLVGERAKQRAARVASLWKNQASLYLGVASGREDGKPVVCIASINAYGEIGQTMRWEPRTEWVRDTARRGAAQPHALPRLAEMVADELTEWLSFLNPPFIVVESAAWQPS